METKKSANEHTSPDDGLEAFQKATRENLQIDETSARRIRRKADTIVMPLCCVAYALQFLDRSSLSYASIMGMIEDLSLRGQNYSWLSSSFFISYLVMEIPSARLLQIFSPGRYMGVCAILWGISCASFAAIHNFQQAVALRVLLGIFEACVSPALILIISQWYKKEEQSLRTGLWVSFNGFAQIFGSSVAYGFAKGGKEMLYDITPWRIIFILNGTLSVVIGILFLIFVPKNPLSAWWLSEEDRVLAVVRVKANQQGIGNSEFKLYQLREAFTDPFAIGVFLLAIMGDIPNGGLVNYFSQIIVSFGYTPQESLLYSCPAGAVAAFGIIAWGILSHVFDHRLLWGAGAALTSLVGVCLLVFLPAHERLGRLFGYYLTTVFPACLASALSLISSNVAGYTKKSTVAAMFFVGYCTGNIIGPQMFRADQAPEYRSGEIVILTMIAACSLDVIFLYAYLRWRNKKNRGSTATAGSTDGKEFLDLTDREYEGFVYAF